MAESSEFWLLKLNAHLLRKEDAWGLEMLRNYMRELCGEKEMELLGRRNG